MKLKDLLRKNCDDYTSITGLGTEDFKLTLIGSENNLIDVEIGIGDDSKILETTEHELKNLMVGIGRFLDTINKEVK